MAGSGDHQERLAAGRELVHGLSQFSEVIEQQLIGVREMIEESVNQVMDSINLISKKKLLKELRLQVKFWKIHTWIQMLKLAILLRVFKLPLMI